VADANELVGPRVVEPEDLGDALDHDLPGNNGNFQEMSEGQVNGSPTAETSVCHTVGSV
jgi:hypothetical protein